MHAQTRDRAQAQQQQQEQEERERAEREEEEERQRVADMPPWKRALYLKKKAAGGGVCQHFDNPPCPVSTFASLNDVSIFRTPTLCPYQCLRT